MLLADSTETVIAVVGAAAASGFGTWIVTALNAQAAARRVKRIDAIDEWKGIVNRQQEEIKDLKADACSLDKRVMDLIRSEGECRERVARQEGIIQALTADVRRLQAIAHDTVPDITVPCVITASAEDGKIRAVSPSSGPLFGWLPSELLGRSISVLVPDDIEPQHREGLGRVARGERRVDPTKTLHVVAKKRTGELVHITVNLSQWVTPKGSTMLSAEIRPDVTHVVDGCVMPPGGGRLSEPDIALQ